jgi:hypothetical protein
MFASLARLPNVTMLLHTISNLHTMSKERKHLKNPREGWREKLEAAMKSGDLTYDDKWLEANLDTALEELETPDL